MAGCLFCTETTSDRSILSREGVKDEEVLEENKRKGAGCLFRCLILFFLYSKFFEQKWSFLTHSNAQSPVKQPLFPLK
jgi:hypothetical protein